MVLASLLYNAQFLPSPNRTVVPEGDKIMRNTRNVIYDEYPFDAIALPRKVRQLLWQINI